MNHQDALRIAAANVALIHKENNEGNNMQTKVKHTQGPWKFEKIHDAPLRNGWWITDRKLIKIARLGVWGQKTDSAARNESIANANLIAAAPELLKGCKNALAWMTHGVPSENKSRAFSILEKAVAKAEGK